MPSRSRCFANVWPKSPGLRGGLRPQPFPNPSDKLDDMVNPILNKIPAKPVDLGLEQGGTTPAKTGDSKFDQVRARLIDQQAGQVQMPAAVTQVSNQQQKVLAAQLSSRLEQTKGTPVHKLFAADMKTSQAKIDRLSQQVNALPKTSAFEPLRSRLALIDQQYQSAGRLVNSIKGSNNSPADLMKIQVQMYQLSENLELMSKVVEQVTSGMKTLFQTQL